MVGIALIRGIMDALKQALTMRSTEAPGVYIVLLVLLLSYYNNSITTVRQWLLIGKVDNAIYRIMVIYMYGRWLSVGAKTWGRYVPHGMWKWVFVPLNGSVGPLAW